ncbi:MAG: sugar transferase [Deltaproteobacteria bacterium]|nr:sugar transferase [Deltaproteobacteria bacterium]
MTTVLAAVEVSSIFLAVGGTMTLYGSPSSPSEIAAVLARFASRLIPALLVASVLLAVLYTVFFPDTGVNSAPFLLSVLITVGFLVPIRFCFYRVMTSRSFVKRVLVLGTSPLAHSIIEELRAQPHFGYALVGVVDDELASLEASSYKSSPALLGALDKIIDEVRPDGIIVALRELKQLPARKLLELRLRDIFIEDGVDIYERFTGKLAIEWYTPSRIVFSKDFRKSFLDLAVGRCVSLIAAIAGLLIFAPILGLIALAIKLDSKGPVFFVQDRVGLKCRPFKLVKFRTMHCVNGKTSEWARDNGHRITRVGTWLRSFRLDELPQFINILRGDMNLVGPRPHPVTNFELFVLVLRNAPESGDEIPYYSLRCAVRPGITGWAQNRFGYANGLEEEIEKMKYDLYYIKHNSLWFDLHILLDTIKTVLSGRESKGAPSHPGKEVETLHKAA